MSTRTIALDAALYDYWRSVSLREPSTLRAVREYAATHPMGSMQIAPEQAQFMALLVQLMTVRKALELGVFLGYSALAIALALPPDGTLIACEVSDEYAAIARQFWVQAGVADKIDLRLGPAIATLQQLCSQGEADTFDLIFIDADKRSYDDYYEQALTLARPGGLIAIDNVFWGGRVADASVNDNRTQRMRSLNQKLHQDDRIDLSIVPIGDGLTLARKR